MSPPRKKPRVVLEQTYDVESIEDIQFINNEIVFEVKWENWEKEHNTYEPFEHLVNNIIFQQFVSEKYTKNKQPIKDMKEEVVAKNLEVLTTKKMLNEDFDELLFKSLMIAKVVKNIEDDRFDAKLEKMIVENRLFKMHNHNIRELKEFQKIINETEEVHLRIENYVDFTVPKDFIYTTKNIFDHPVLNTSSYSIKEKGCECDTCETNTKECCPSLQKRRFPYKKKSCGTVLRLDQPEKLIECNDACQCDQSCLNRVTQQKVDHEFVLYKTNNGRGFGLRTESEIKKGQFVVEYTGRLTKESEAQAENTSYQFSMDATDGNVWVIDALDYGNLARFINHSCGPNLKTWIVNNCSEDPTSQKICFFAKRSIAPGEELTIDYDDGKQSKQDSKSKRDTKIEKGEKCMCGAKNCKEAYFIVPEEKQEEPKSMEKAG